MASFISSYRSFIKTAAATGERPMEIPARARWDRGEVRSEAGRERGMKIPCQNRIPILRYAEVQINICRFITLEIEVIMEVIIDN
jgi:hypothetical protein